MGNVNNLSARLHISSGALFPLFLFLHFLHYMTTAVAMRFGNEAVLTKILGNEILVQAKAGKNDQSARRLEQGHQADKYRQ